MFRPGQSRRLIDMVVVDAAGDWVGTVSEVFLDRRTGDASWVTVRLGWFGPGVFVPLLGLDVSGIRIRAPYNRATIMAAPRHDPFAPLTPAEEHALNVYYGLPAGDPPAPGFTGPGPGPHIADLLHATADGTEAPAGDQTRQPPTSH